MAMIQSHYEINVSLNGRHLFATAERSCVTQDDLNKVLDIFVAKFPKSEGYKISYSHIKCEGRSKEVRN
jgi:hypothetical protein